MVNFINDLQKHCYKQDPIFKPVFLNLFLWNIELTKTVNKESNLC
jgi:hypothetical protein